MTATRAGCRSRSRSAPTVGRASVAARDASPRTISSRGTCSRRASASSIDLVRQRQDRDQGELRSLLAQPGRRRRRQRQPEHRRQVVDLGVGTTPTAIKRWQPGEETHACITDVARRAPIELDPNLKAPYTHEASAWIERQLTDTMGVRAGFVYKTEDDLITPNNYQTLRGAGARTRLPFTFIDIGVDGVRGTADDRNVTMLGFPTANAAAVPDRRSSSANVPQFSRYKTVEASMNKRYGNKWSASLGGSYTMMNDFPNNYPQNPNNPGAEDRSTWSFKATAQLRRAVGHPHLAGASSSVGRRTTRARCRFRRRRSPASASVGAARVCRAARMRTAKTTSTVFDVRAEKSFSLTTRLRVRTYAGSRSTSPTATPPRRSRARPACGTCKPTAILAPFTARVGFRVLF